MKKLIIALLVLCQTTYAAETDHYMSMDFELPNMSAQVNRLINRLYDEHIDEINKKLKNKALTISCEDMTLKIGKSFLGLNYNPLKDALLEDPNLTVYPPINKNLKAKETYKGSIYEGASKKYLYFSHIPLDPVLNIDGIYISFDKFVHFQGSGYVYYKKYLSEIKRGKSEEEAMLKGIKWGLSLEKGILGLIGSGVLSYGDLEANFQGSVFYKKFCSEDPYITRDIHGLWKRTKEIDIAQYLTPHIDEIFNPNVHRKSRWKKYIKADTQKNCDKRFSSVFSERMNFYRTFPKSFNQLTMDKFKEEGKAPDNKDFNIFNICR